MMYKASSSSSKQTAPCCDLLSNSIHVSPLPSFLLNKRRRRNIHSIRSSSCFFNQETKGSLENSLGFIKKSESCNYLLNSIMDAHRGEKNGPWLSVPQFGNWDQQKGGIPDYSMDFSKIREMRKQNKRDISRTSIGNEELVPEHKSNKFGSHHHSKFGNHHHNKFGTRHHNKYGTHHRQLGSPNNHSSARRTIMSYFCCI